MNERISDERIAQLLDGNISADERAELLSQLAADGDDFAVFAETGGVLRELEEAESGPETAPLAETPPVVADAPAPGRPADRQPPPSTRQPSRWGGRRARWLALVPVLALALLVPVLWSRGGAGGPGAPAGAMMADARLPVDWLNRGPPWPTTRGSERAPGSDASAARIGVLHADLALAVASRDAETTTLLVRLITYRLGEESALGYIADYYRPIGERAGAPPTELQPLLEEAGEQVMSVMDADRVRLGSWAEGARIAAARRDTAFFRASETRRAFRRAAADETLPQETRDAAGRIRRADPDAFDDLGRDAHDILAVIGRADPQS